MSTEDPAGASTLHWDFFGPRAAGTAAHFRRHLDEFLAREGLAGCATGLASAGPGHEGVWCRAPRATADVVARALRPRRREGAGAARPGDDEDDEGLV